MFLAKHAKSAGAPDAEDGNHAVYHHELAQTLRGLGLNLTLGSSYDDLAGAENIDFVFTLLNRGGFLNSEMLGPLLARRRGLPFLGASPILRGLGDDKHLAKLAARARGVPTAPSHIHRAGSGPLEIPDLGPRMVVKPNASSASWGLLITSDKRELRPHAEWLLSEGHDVLFERYVEGVEIAVPVIGGAEGEPVLLPVMQYGADEGGHARSYEEKRGLVAADDAIHLCEHQEIAAKAARYARLMMAEMWPFDYGRFEFRACPVSGEVSFLEVNMSCNLWSKKCVAQSWMSLGFTYAELVETILCSSLIRQGVTGGAVETDDKDMRDEIYSPGACGPQARREQSAC